MTRELLFKIYTKRKLLKLKSKNYRVKIPITKFDYVVTIILLKGAS